MICGYNIPKGIQVVFPTIVTGNMEEYCSNASSFQPERWLKANQGGVESHIHPFASLPYVHFYLLLCFYTLMFLLNKF